MKTILILPISSAKDYRKRPTLLNMLAVEREGLSRIERGAYDLIILDIMLPEMNGIEVCKELRKRGVETPVIMLTAKNSVKDKVSGLQCGADDYITKPFSFDEFLARIHAIMRRRQGKIIELIFGDLKLDTISHRVFFRNEEVILRPKEYAVLKFLLGNQGRILTRTQVLENVWGYNYDPATNIVDVYIKTLREKLTPLFQHDIIRTVRGMGYMIEGA